jgi:hypothetical protein
MQKQYFLSAVEHEVRSLKENATAEELGRLDFDSLNPSYADRCIYGQMTGNCGSIRARNLMIKGCTMVAPLHITSNRNFTSIRRFIVKSNNDNDWNFRSRTFNYFSALEHYIIFKGSKNAHIISFLKGETKRLRL